MDVELSPLRTLDDFLLASAHFQIPNYKDWDKWGNRVVNNLLYYQTNYFLTTVIIFLLVCLCYPKESMSGLCALVAAFTIYYYFTKDDGVASRFKKEHPIFGLFFVLASGYFIVYMLASVLVFLFSILLPVGVIFLHASMRLRSIKNKITNKIEMVGFKKTPMGMFLNTIDTGRELHADLNFEKLVKVK